MERKQEEERWVQNSNISINGDDIDNHHDHQECLCDLKREISCHSLYNLLLQSHINCLKLCLGNNNMVNIENEIKNQTAILNQQGNLFLSNQPELDQFMEAYCMSLQKLKEEMEEPQQESMAFINFMYSELDHLLIDGGGEKLILDEDKCNQCI